MELSSIAGKKLSFRLTQLADVLQAEYGSGGIGSPLEESMLDAFSCPCLITDEEGNLLQVNGLGKPFLPSNALQRNIFLSSRYFSAGIKSAFFQSVHFDKPQNFQESKSENWFFYPVNILSEKQKAVICLEVGRDREFIGDISEEKLALEALYRVNEGILILDTEGAVVFVNEEAKALFNTRHKEKLVGKNLRVFLKKEPDLWIKLEKLLAGKTIKDFEFSFQTCLSGSVYRLSAFLLPNQSGYYFLQLQDVSAEVNTRQKMGNSLKSLQDLNETLLQEENLLIESDAELRRISDLQDQLIKDFKQQGLLLNTVIENLPLGFHLFDQNGQTLRVNKIQRAYLGLKTPEAEATSFNVLQDHMIREVGLMPYFEKAFQGKHIIDHEVEARFETGFSLSEDKSGRFFNLSIIPLFDYRTHKVMGVFWLMQDISEKKQFEEKLQVKDFAIASSISPIVLLTLDATINLTNQSFLSMWGFSEEKEVLGRKLAEVVPSEDPLSLFLTKVKNDGHAVKEMKFLKKGKLPVYIKLTANVIQDTRQKPKFLMVTMDDTTSDKLANDRIRNSERRLRSFFNQNLIGMGVVSPEKEWVRVNNRLCEILGYSRRGVLTKKWQELIHPLDLDKSLASLEDVTSGNADNIRLETRFLNSFGSEVHTITTFQAIRDRDRKIEYFISFVLDISDLKQYEKSLNMSRFTLDRAYDGVLWVKPSGEVFYVNQRASIMTGYSAQELFQIPVYDHYPEMDQQQWSAHWQKLEKTDNQLLEISFQRKDGSEFFAELTENVITFDDISFALVFIKDITDRKREEQLLFEKNAELQKINQELDQFVYSASHQLRSPISSIMGLINLARNLKEQKEINSMLNLMERSMQKLDDTIHEIDHFSRNARMEMEMAEINTESLVEEVLERLNYFPRVNEIKVKFINDLSRPFFSDAVRVRIILENLLSNAFKYSDFSREPEVIISFRSNSNSVLLSVSDNGIGIDASEKEKIFKMFHRSTEVASGAGLGLYIIRETIEKLGGSVRVQSVMHEGSTFVVTFPG